MKWVIFEEQEGMLLKEFLLKEASFSKRLLIKVKSKEGSILVNGFPKTVRYVLRKGDLLAVMLPDEKPAKRMIKEKLP